MEGQGRQTPALNRRTEILAKEKDKCIRTVTCGKKELTLLEVIDTQRCVRIKLHILMRWYDPDFASESACDISNSDQSSAARDEHGNFRKSATLGEIAEPQWKPILRFPHASPLHGPPVVVRDDYSLYNAFSGQIGCHREIVATLDQELDHAAFPFDRQLLEFQITAVTPNDMPLPRVGLECSVASASTYSSTQEWRFKGSGGSIADFSCLHNTVRVVAGIERLPAYYVWNLAAVLVIITSMAALAFIVPLDEVADRLALNFTLVLTTVAFKFTVAANLPRISYLTKMDKLVLGCFASLTICGIEHALVAEIDSELGGHTAKTIDRLFLAVAGGCWLLVHVSMALCYFCNQELLRQGWDDKLIKMEASTDSASPRGQALHRLC